MALDQHTQTATAAGSAWQRAEIVAVTGQADYALPAVPDTDGDGDPMLQIVYLSTTALRGVDWTVAGAILSWIGAVALADGEILEVWYVPA